MIHLHKFVSGVWFFVMTVEFGFGGLYFFLPCVFFLLYFFCSFFYWLLPFPLFFIGCCLFLWFLVNGSCLLFFVLASVLHFSLDLQIHRELSVASGIKCKSMILLLVFLDVVFIYTLAATVTVIN